MKRIFGLLVILIGLFALSACSKSKVDPKIVGEWEYSLDGFGAKYVLNEDGTGTYTLINEDYVSEQNITYRTEDNTIYMIFEGDTDEFENKYRIDGENLYVTDSFGEETQFVKK